MSIQKILPFLLSVFVSVVAFNSEAQIVISAGNPVDGAEGSGNITFDVFIEGGGVNTTGAPITGSITYGGTATPGGDFTPVNSFSIPIGANSTTITLVVIDDLMDEGTESVTIILSGSPSTGTYGNMAITAGIIDNDGLIVSIGSPVNGMEGSTNVSYVISLDNGAVNNTGADLIGSISYSGTATSGVDYIGSTTFVIPNGASSTSLTLVVPDDALLECDETVDATLTNVNIGTINPSAMSASAIIVDDECSSAGISIGSPVDGMEGASPISFVVGLDGGVVNSTGAAITGAISYVGTALDASDYIGVTGFSIANGANSTTISIAVIDDILVECDETVIATISNPSVGTINTSTSSAIIVDDECSQVGISIDSPMDGAEGGNDVSFVVSLDGGMVNATGSAITGSVSYAGTATASVDFSEVTAFSIPDGASSTTISLTVLDDVLLECDETVIATISNPSIGTINTATSSAIIVDDECLAQYSLSIGLPVDGEEQVSDVAFTVYLENGVINTTGSAITGLINFTGTSSPSDFSFLPSTFTIPDGQSSTLITLSVLDDNCIEMTETVIATISNPSTGSINISSSTANLVDDDAAVASISIGNPVDGFEGGNDMSFDIFLDNGLVNCSGAPITGEVSFGGTATSGNDFVNYITFTIPDGSSSVTHLLPIADDVLDECDETVIATIFNPSVGVINSMADTSTAIIFDNDCTNTINELKDVQLKLYPNPVHDQLNVAADKPISSYVLYDLNGRQVLGEQLINSTSFTISTDQLAKGSYIIQVDFENGSTYTDKLLKK